MIAVSRAPGLAVDQLEEALGHHAHDGVSAASAAEGHKC